MDDLSRTGVYCIVNLVNGKRYVGSAAHGFRMRWAIHKRTLVKGTHHSSRLQNAWNKYGPEAFEWRVCEYCSDQHCIAVEQTFIDFYKSSDRQHGYNIYHIAGSARGTKHTPEVRKRLSELAKLQFSTKEALEAHSDRQKLAHSSDEYRALQSERAKKQFGTPEARAAMSKRGKLRFATPEAKLAWSEQMKVISQRPHVKARKAELARERFGSQKARRATSQRMRKEWEDAAYREKKHEINVRTWASPEKREAARARGKARFSDPEFCERFRKAVKDGMKAAKQRRDATQGLLFDMECSGK